MARIIYSALIDSIRGSIGGTTFQKNAYGYTVKKKPNMIRPNTPFQQFQKTLFAQAVRAWNQLSAAQRTDWDTWSSTYPQYSKYNPSSQLSGFAVFTRIHVYRFMTDRAVLTNPTYTTYVQDTITLGATLDGSVLYLDVTSVTESEDWWLVLSISRPFSGSQNFVGTRTRFVTHRTNLTDQINITAAYLAAFGVLPAVGQKLAFEVVPYGAVNGQVLARETTVTTVVSA